MSPDEVDAALRHLSSAFPRELTDDTFDVWRASFSASDGRVVTLAIMEWIETGQFFPKPAEIHGLARRIRDREAPPPEERPGGCGGSGWIVVPIDRVLPCPRCNPVLHELYRDPKLVRRYHNGESIDRLVPGVRRGTGGSYEMTDGQMPPRCLETHDYDQVIGFEEGRKIAFAAAAADPTITPGKLEFVAQVLGLAEGPAPKGMFRNLDDVLREGS